MFQPLSLCVGLRYAGLRSSGVFPVVSLVSVLGLALGVALLVIVLSVMNGFDRELRERILSLLPHASLHSDQPINDWRALVERIERAPGVRAAPMVRLRGVLIKGQSSAPTLIYGVDPDEEPKVSGIEGYIHSDEQPSGGARAASRGLELLRTEPNAALLGLALAKRLGGVRIGERLRLLIPESGGGAPRHLPVRFYSLSVAGFFESGAEMDGSVLLTALPLAMTMSGSELHSMRLRFDNLFQAPSRSRALAARLSAERDGTNYYAANWTRSHGNLYQAIQLSKRVVSLLLLIVIGVAAFNVVSGLVMLVDEKRGAVAIMRTLGCRRRTILAIFIIQGTALGVAGVALGAFSGVLLARALPRIASWLESALGLRFLDATIYPVNYLPVDIQAFDVLWVCVITFFISTCASIYPAWCAAGVEPADALRYE